MTLSRRTFLATSAVSGLTPLMPGLNVAFGADPDIKSGNQVLIFLFLRFGMDGLSLIVPADDGAYRDNRPTLGLSSSGVGAAPYLDTHQGVPFFINPAARQLKTMYDAKTLAVIHAAGVPTELRSHFEVQVMVGQGVGRTETAPKGTGWLARHLLAKNSERSDFSAVSDGTGMTTSLEGLGGTLSFSNLATLGGALYGRFADAITAMHPGNSPLEQSVQKAVRVAAAVREKAQAIPVGASGGNYTYGALSNVLRPLAQVIKMDVGVELATADFLGWDHHEYQGNSFPQQAGELGNALFAFNEDLGEHAKRVTVVMMTEFGRRVRENANNGTDHGAGAVMLVQGAGVNGGKMYGDWPGLKDNQLDQGDLAVTTDYRRVLAEALVKRQGQTAVETVFPTVAYSPLGVFS